MRCTKDYDQEMIDHIRVICTLLKIDFIEYVFTTVAELLAYLQVNPGIDFLYLGAHGNHECFGEKTPPYTSWDDFASALCQSQRLNTDAVLFLGCCHGGLKKVAMTIFANCDQVRFVCGPRWKASKHEISVAVHVFLYNLLIGKEEPTIAAERCTSATGIAFPFYDRYELDTEIELKRTLCWLPMLSAQPPPTSP